MIQNTEIARRFYRLADLLEIDDANPFRVRAYREAARVVEGLPENAGDMIARGEDLSRLRGLGKDLSGKVRTLVETGHLPVLEEAEARMPPVLVELMRVAGLGPKRIRSLYQRLQIETTDDLLRAADAHHIRELPGFGEKTEQMIADGVRRLQSSGRRYRLADAERVALPLLDYLRASPGVHLAEIAGSFRRRRETVGDIDLLVCTDDSPPVMQRFVDYPEVAHVLSRGRTRATVQLRDGMQVDLRVVPEASFGAALHYFTGSKPHNIAIRRRGIQRKLKINEYGIFQGAHRIGGGEEREVFAAVGLPFIPPELREDSGEITAAEAGRLPHLVELKDLRGDLHIHTRASDGRLSLEAVVTAARALGHEYIAITDHSRHAALVHGLDPKRLEAQMAAIDRLNAQFDGFTVLKGIEMDILEEGSPDLPEELLARLDVRVCSIHYRLDLPREQQTARVLRAMERPWFNILAHPTGRLIGERPPCEIDLERIIRAARDTGCFLELNSQPKRLDLDDRHCRLAKEYGVKVAISSDTHSESNLRFLRHGIDQARRGWLEPDDIINTRPLAELMRLLRRNPGHAP